VVVGAAADAAREGARVRVAAAALAHDADQPACVDALGQSRKLLMLLDLGDASEEATALGLLFAADRVEMARGLPEVGRAMLSPVRKYFRTPIIGFFVDWEDDGTELERATLGEAIANRLRPVDAPPLSELIRSVVLRLDADYGTARARYEPERDWSDP
jgi:hypothetical protein